MKNFIILSINVLLFFFVAESKVLACSCPGPDKEKAKAVNKNFNRASVVFLGRVIAKEYIPIKSNSDGRPASKRMIIKFAVDSVWKGHFKNVITLDTSKVIIPDLDFFQGSGCEYSFDINKSYLVYANSKSGKLIAHECSGTSPVERASEDIRELQKLKKVGGKRSS